MFTEYISYLFWVHFDWAISQIQEFFEKENFKKNYGVISAYI